MADMTSTIFNEPAQRYALVQFHCLLLEMLEADHARGTIAQGKWWAKNLEKYMKDGTLPGRRDADPKVYAAIQ